MFAYSNGRVDMHIASLSDVLAQNKKTADAYFVANTMRYGMKTANLKDLRTFFVDIDAGRDATGSYHPTAFVNKVKKSAIAKLKDFPVKPSYIVDTRNGVHAYWIMKTPMPATAQALVYHNDIQAKLVQYFTSVGADEIVKKPNQLMRVPYTYWRKKWVGEKNFPAYFSKIVYENDVRNDRKNMLSALSGVTLPEKRSLDGANANFSDIALTPGQKRYGSYTPKEDLTPKITDDLFDRIATTHPTPAEFAGTTNGGDQDFIKMKRNDLDKLTVLLRTLSYSLKDSGMHTTSEMLQNTVKWISEKYLR